MTPKEAAAVVGVSAQTMRTWAVEGVVPCRVVERPRKRVYLFDRATLEAWLVNREPQRQPTEPDFDAVA